MAKSDRGFASMDPAKQRAIARKGGQSVAPEDRAFSQNPKLASEAGRKGGQASHKNRQSRSDSSSRGRGSNLSSEARSRGGQNSRSGGRDS